LGWEVWRISEYGTFFNLDPECVGQNFQAERLAFLGSKVEVKNVWAIIRKGAGIIAPIVAPAMGMKPIM